MVFSLSLPAFLVCLALHQTGGAKILGADDFPSNYCMSSRRLTSSILSTRPQNLPTVRVEYNVPTASKFNYMLQVDPSAILKQEDVAALKQEVARIENHFRAIPAFSKQGSNPSNFGVQEPGSDDFQLTSLAHLYNLFFLNSDHIGKLYWAVKVSFHQYAEVHRLDLSRPYFIHGWLNCFRRGGHIKFHAHGNDGVSGNLGIHIPPGSYTHYLKASDSTSWHLLYDQATQMCKQGNKCTCPLKWPYKGRKPPASMLGGEDFRHWNREGEIMLFHSTTSHGSSPVTDRMMDFLKTQDPKLPACRMTAGFDISPHPNLLQHSLPLFDPMDPWWEKDPQASFGEGMSDDVDSIFGSFGIPPTYQWPSVPSSEDFWNRWKKCTEKLKRWCDFIVATSLNETMARPTREPYTQHSAKRVVFYNQCAKTVFVFRHDGMTDEQHLSKELRPGMFISRPTNPGDTWIFRVGSDDRDLWQYEATAKPIQTHLLCEHVEL